MYTYEDARADYKQQKAEAWEAFEAGEIYDYNHGDDFELYLSGLWKDCEQYIDDPDYWERR
jgi:hypothetical protein